MRRKLRIRRDIRKRRSYKCMEQIKAILNELRQRPLIKQRTPEWFKLRENRLTASDLYDAIKNPLSLARRKLKGVTYNSSAIPALKWGTMYEPMATRIYANIVKKEIYEFGLIINDDIKNFGASPDGITNDGIMIEIKCPIKRKIIDGCIPDKYYYQIQGQLAVCNLKECDYIECEFSEFDDDNEYLSGVKGLDNYKHGIIAELKIRSDYNYHYSTDNQEATENLKEMKAYEAKGYRLIYWKLNLINIQKVAFDEEKWKNEIEAKINNFHDIYMKEKKENNPLNLFINEDD